MAVLLGYGDFSMKVEQNLVANNTAADHMDMKQGMGIIQKHIGMRTR